MGLQLLHMSIHHRFLSQKLVFQEDSYYLSEELSMDDIFLEDLWYSKVLQYTFK